MSFSQKLGQFFSNRSETNDKHWNESLQTRYYKTTKDKAMSTVENVLGNTQRFEVNFISKDHGEINIGIKKGKKAFIIATIVMVKPYQTAIDFTVTTESIIPIDFGYSRKVISELYEQINKELTLIK